MPDRNLGGTSAAGRLRVCFLVDTLETNAGTEKLVAALATRVNRDAFEAHVCCFEKSGRLSGLDPAVRTAVFPLLSVNSVSGIRQAWRFRQYVKRHSIDIVHSFMPKSDIFNVISCFRSTCPIIITSRLNTGYWYTPKYIRLFRVLNRYTTQVVSNSICAKSIAVDREKLPPEKIRVLYTGVDLERYASSAGDLSVSASLGISADSQVVGIVARYRPVKDLALFLKAAKIVSAAVQGAAFLLIGEGPLKSDLERLAIDLGIRDRVFFTDAPGTVPDYLARMSVACLSSESEGLPNAILEYMAAGLPVVATDVGGNSELVVDGVTGYLVRERTPEVFAAPIIELLQNSVLRMRMGQEGLKRVRKEFDLAAAVKRLEDFYIEVAAGVHGWTRSTRPLSTVPAERK